MERTRTIVIRENRRNKIEFSVNPKELTISSSNNNIREHLDQLGDIIIPGKKGLRQIKISTFIPSDNSFGNGTGGTGIKKALRLIERWKKEKTKLRIIISDPEVNFKAIINADELTLKEGQNDVWISLSLVEYREIHVQTVESITGLIAVSDEQSRVVLKERETETAPMGQTTEIVSAQTTLWGLAAKHYGNGNEWRKISDANAGIDPKKLKKGMILKIP